MNQCDGSECALAHHARHICNGEGVMRRGWLAAIVVICGCFVLEAQAGSAVVLRVAHVRPAPGVYDAALATLSPGDVVEVLEKGERWSLVSCCGLRGYVATALIGRAGRTLYYSPEDSRSCDLGYPYSGSAGFFEGLPAVRHSGPLGWLLGTHVRRPC
jgi:hypothetical protein